MWWKHLKYKILNFQKLFDISSRVELFWENAAIFPVVWRKRR